MKPKTNVKPAKFYQEAEEMQKGWGVYLKNIDQLKDAVTQQKPMTIKDYCWTLYGNGHTSHCWKQFQRYYQQHFGTVSLNHRNFSFIFKGWIDKVYDPHSNE